MLSQLLVKDNPPQKSATDMLSPLDTDSEDDRIDKPTSARKQKSKRKYCHAWYMEEGENVSSF